MTSKEIIRTLSECIGLLSIHGFNTKAEARDKLIALRRELEEDEMSIDKRIQRAFERSIDEIEKELPF